VFPLHNDAL
jgi:hypothetical protein